MNKQTVARIESAGLNIIISGAIAGFLTMFVCGPWPYQLALPELAFMIYGPLLQTSYPAALFVLWAACVLAGFFCQWFLRSRHEPSAITNR